MVIVVGTENQIKVKAVEMTAKELFGEVEVLGINVSSGVSSQPRTDSETRKGARLRAERALQSIKVAQVGIGIEGGVHPTKNGLQNTVWVCVVERGSKEHWFANGVRFYLPKRIADAITSGKEMGQVLDEITKQKDTKKSLGMVGTVTKGKLDRASAYAAVIKLALGLLHGKDWEKDY
ncbi:MAG TPA: inosine/xanthosine triphosphatase [Patescibacteria group bacterium]|nr:inosine/xanthosine triphosphatase [Patescibacteria group bacterium]